MSRRIPRLLDPVEIRVLGALLEKEQTTPEAYPLSLNALVAACDQKTNREPVMQLTESEVAAAVERLRQDVLVWRTDGARVERFKQSVDRRWDLDPPSKALLTQLLLRGPQTTGQLGERSERMHRFDSLAQVEQLLERLAAQDEPLVGQLPRRLGQRELRWCHLLGDAPAASESAFGAEAPAWPAPRTAPSVASAAHDGNAASAAAAGRAGGGGSAGQVATTAHSTYAAPASGPPAAAPSVAQLVARIEALERRMERLETRLLARSDAPDAPAPAE
jgi:uncharacterized protein